MNTFSSFNVAINNLSKPIIRDDDVATLTTKLKHILMQDGLNFSTRDMNASSFLLNIYEVLLNTRHEELIEKCAQILQLIGQNEECRVFVRNFNFLPALVDHLATIQSKSIRILLLQLISDLICVRKDRATDYYVGKLFEILISIISLEENDDMGLLAISILINMCENNPENLQILRNQIQPVNLMKRVSAAHYGILAGKLCHVLDGIHQAITAADVVSYLLPIDAQMTKALMSSDAHTIAQITFYFREIAELNVAHLVVSSYSFSETVRAICEVLNNLDSVENDVLKHLLDFIGIIIVSKNNSFDKMYEDLLKAATKRSHLAEALQMAFEIFNQGVSFDENILLPFAEELKRTIKNCHMSPKAVSAASVALKLVPMLPDKYHILSDNAFKAVTAPFDVECVPFSSFSTEMITLILQCLQTALKIKMPIVSNLSEKNYQYIIAMSIKHGDPYQVKLAVELLKKIENPLDYTTRLISNSNRNEMGATHTDGTMLTSSVMNQTVFDQINPTINVETTDRLMSAIRTIERAARENKFQQVNISDYVKLFQSRADIQQRQICYQQSQIAELHKQLTHLTQRDLMTENLIANHTELNHSLHVTIENLKEEVTCKDGEILKQVNMNKSCQIKINNYKNEIEKLNHEVHALQTKFEKSNEKVAHLEQVIADNEDMNIKVLNLISQNKRRK